MTFAQDCPADVFKKVSQKVLESSRENRLSLSKQYLHPLGLIFVKCISIQEIQML